MLNQATTAEDTTGASNNNVTDNKSKLDASQPRDKAIMVTDHADLNQLALSDSNFKVLIKHCLQSQDLNACESMALWDVSHVTDCSYLFWEQVVGDDSGREEKYVLIKGAETFNVDLSAWNVGSCTTMQGMFNGAESFNQDIGAWDTSLVTDMSAMFEGARVFNRDISLWKTGRGKEPKPSW
jgi:surface protein